MEFELSLQFFCSASFSRDSESVNTFFSNSFVTFGHQRLAGPLLTWRGPGTREEHHDFSWLSKVFSAPLRMLTEYDRDRA
jgi:hypothetical protein